MNDRYRFRAWDKEKSKMHYGIQTPTKLLGGADDLKFEFWELLDDEMFKVMQYTGLCDKNGTLIYEGDIISDCMGRIGEVAFQDGAFGVKFMDGGQYLCFANEKGEVIGNIHLNPELLRGEE